MMLPLALHRTVGNVPGWPRPAATRRKKGGGCLGNAGSHNVVTSPAAFPYPPPQMNNVLLIRVPLHSPPPHHHHRHTQCIAQDGGTPRRSRRRSCFPWPWCFCCLPPPWRSACPFDASPRRCYNSNPGHRRTSTGPLPSCPCGHGSNDNGCMRAWTAWSRSSS